MKIFLKVKVKPRSKEEKVEKIDEDHFIVWTKEVPDKGKANKSILSLLAENLNISISSLKIVSGFASKNKIIKLEKI